MQTSLDVGNNEVKMGLDRKKPILTKDDFNIDPFYAKNSVLSVEQRDSLPHLEDDVMLDKRQSIYYSLEHVLKKLLDNDKFIDEYIKKTINQLQYVNKDRISNAVNQNYLIDSSMLTAYSSMLNQHWAEYHENVPCSLGYVSQHYAKSNLSNFDVDGARKNFISFSDGVSAMSSSVSASLSNDFVINCEFSDNVRRPTNYVNATVCNKMTGGVFNNTMNFDITVLAQVPSLTSLTYIYKEWLSGMKELYIYLPTTFTMYNENKKINDDDYYAGEDVANNSTLIQIKINGRHFKLNHIYQAYICGQSLPLQIHNEDGSMQFTDVILPSMLKTMCVQPMSSKDNNVQCIYNQNTSMYQLYFTCYGTDAQAIRIFGD